MMIVDRRHPFPISLLSLLVMVSLTLLSSCTAPSTALAPVGCDQSEMTCLQGKAVVLMETSKGTIRFEVDGDSAPMTAGNFIDLVKRGAYDGTLFHRVVKDPVPFVVQGGDPASSDPKTPASQYGTGSFVDPETGKARFIPLEIKLRSEQKPRYGRVTTNPSELLKLELSHEPGALAMARSQDPDSASAQFYIALKALPELDGRYAVFGRVIQGMDVVNSIEQNDRIIKASLLKP